MRFTLFFITWHLSICLSAQTPKDPRGEQIIVAMGNKATSNFMLYPPNTTAKGSFENITNQRNAAPGGGIWESVCQKWDYYKNATWQC